MASVEQHVAAFYALGGETISEVAKNYTSFERSLSYDGFNSEAFFSIIKPTNFRQELFRLKLLRKFNRQEDLFKILLNDPKIISKLALKDSGLIKHISSMNEEDLVEQVLDTLSYTTRTQLINKLSFSVNDESKGLKLYKAVLGKYGMKIANPLLVACAEETIIEAIEEHEIKFWHQQLIRCYKKSTRILEAYFKKNSNFQNYSKLGQYLCMNDVATFHSLLKFGCPNIGKKACINYIRVYKNEFIKDSDKLRPLFRQDVLSKYLNEKDFIAWFKNLLPKSVDGLDFVWGLREYLMMIPYKIRGKVVFTAFKDHYGFDIWSNQDYISSYLLELLPLEDRKKFDLTDFIEYENTERSIPTLERQLSLTSQLNERISIMRKIVESCKINQDYDALLEVLRKFTKYQKNENKRLRCEFIQLITEFNFRKFTEEHWDYINKIIMQFYVNDDYNYYAGEILLKLIENKISNGLDYFSDMKLFCKFRGFHGLRTFSKKPEEQRSAILKYHSLMDEMVKEEESNSQNTANKTFIDTVVMFNYLYRHDSKIQIQLLNYKDSLEIVVEDIKQNYPEFYNLKKLLNCLYREGKKAEEILSQIFIASSTKYEPYAQYWFLCKMPHIIENNIDSLFKDNKLHTRFCYELSKLENSSLKKKVVHYASKILRSPKEDTARICSSLKILSFCPEINLEEYTKVWHPTDCKIDVHREDMKGLFEIQKALLLSYKNRTCLQDVIPKILQFCNGDYLQFALDPLYYVCNNIPERDLINPLNELLTRSVSFRKHSIHLIVLLTSLEFRRGVFKTLVKTEKNVSLKRFIIKKLCKCLQNERTESDWEFFSSQLYFVDPDDKEIIAELLSSQRIPKTFYTKFIHLLWRHLIERGKSEECQLLDSIQYDKFIFDDSCKEIIRKCLFNPSNKYTEKTYTFAFEYLINSSDYCTSHFADELTLTKSKSHTSEDLKTKIEFIWECIQENYKTADPYKLQKTVHELILFICKQVLQNNSESQTLENSKGLDTITTMFELLPLLKTKHGKFQINLLLETTKMYRSTEPQFFAKYITEKLKTLLNKFGPLIISIYANFLTDFIKIVAEETFTAFSLDVIEEILQCDDSTQTRVFCIGLLPLELSKDSCLRNKYLGVMKKLEEDCSAIVGVEMERLILNLNV